MRTLLKNGKIIDGTVGDSYIANLLIKEITAQGVCFCKKEKNSRIYINQLIGTNLCEIVQTY